MADGRGQTEDPDPGEQWRIPVSTRVRESLIQVPRNLLTPGVCEPLSSLDAPVGCLSPVEQAPPCPSRSAAALVLESLDPDPGDRILVQGRGVGWLALTCSGLVGDATIRVEEEHEGLRARWRSSRTFRMRDGVRLANASDTATPPVDKVLAWDPGRGARERLPARLDDAGSVVIAQPDPHEPRLERIVVHDEDETTLDLTNVVPTPRGITVEAAPTAGDLLHEEALLAGAWTGARPEGLAREVGLGVDETIGQALADRSLTGRAPERAAAARVGFHLGYLHQMLGNLPEAQAAYSASLQILATAEAYTFRGWVRSQRDDVGAAIEDCRRAIDEDPSLGNPYNDIGAYRLEQGRPSEAVEWFQQAIDADRYASREFPYLNLARAYLMLDRSEDAREALHEALDLRPGFEPARRLLDRIEDPLDEFGER